MLCQHVKFSSLSIIRESKLYYLATDCGVNRRVSIYRNTYIKLKAWCFVLVFGSFVLFCFLFLLKEPRAVLEESRPCPLSGAQAEAAASPLCCSDRVTV